MDGLAYAMRQRIRAGKRHRPSVWGAMRRRKMAGGLLRSGRPVNPNRYKS